MSFIDNTINGIRMAGTALGEYASNPATYKQLGKKVALETALGTAVQQAVPRLLGTQAPPVAPGMVNTALQSAFTHPVSGALKAMGSPEWAANMTGNIVGQAGSTLVSNAVARPIADPETNEEPHPQLAQYMELQRMQAAIEQQRYNNQINLAYAKNYSPPTKTTIVHKNPSAEMETVYRILTQTPKYSL